MASSSSDADESRAWAASALGCDALEEALAAQDHHVAEGRLALARLDRPHGRRVEVPASKAL
jgi:hypothetical protein